MSDTSCFTLDCPDKSDTPTVFQTYVLYMDLYKFLEDNECVNRSLSLQGILGSSKEFLERFFEEAYRCSCFRFFCMCYSSGLVQWVRISHCSIKCLKIRALPDGFVIIYLRKVMIIKHLVFFYVLIWTTMNTTFKKTVLQLQLHFWFHNFISKHTYIWQLDTFKQYIADIHDMKVCSKKL